MYKTIKTLEEFNNLKDNNKGILFYFSNETCNVCKILKPKIYEMLKNNYPEIPFYYVDTTLTPDVSAQNSVFTIPTIIIFFDGKETIRKSRHIGVEELKNNISRPYEILF